MGWSDQSLADSPHSHQRTLLGEADPSIGGGDSRTQRINLGEWVLHKGLSI